VTWPPSPGRATPSSSHDFLDFAEVEKLAEVEEVAGIEEVAEDDEDAALQQVAEVEVFGG
jgi:hypothetical protein